MDASFFLHELLSAVSVAFILALDKHSVTEKTSSPARYCHMEREANNCMQWNKVGMRVVPGHPEDRDRATPDESSFGKSDY